MDGFQRRRELKKNNIITAARELFSQFGVQKVSITEIATKANVSQVTIYNYFGNKNELVKHVVMDIMDQAASTFRPILDSNIPFPQKIEKLVFDKKTIFKSTGDQGMLDLVSVQDPEMQKYLEEYAQKHALPMMMELIEQGRNEGYVNPEISTEAIMLYINIFRNATNDPELFQVKHQNMMLDLASLFFYGLMGQPLMSKHAKD